MNTTPSGSPVSVLIRQRYSWRRSFFAPTLCTNATIAAQALIASGTGSMTCVVGSCGPFTSIVTDIPCTDFSVTADLSSGERYDTRTLILGQSYTFTYFSSNWPVFAIGGGGNYLLTGKINLAVRPDGLINTSPLTSTLPIINKQIGIQHTHVIQIADIDAMDTLKCRWATAAANSNGYDECGSICNPSLPTGSQLFTNNCTLVFTLTAVNYYAVALQLEDYYTLSSSTPMSSIPIQFLFYGRPAPTVCWTSPSIIGVRPNLACVGAPMGM